MPFRFDGRRRRRGGVSARRFAGALGLFAASAALVAQAQAGDWLITPRMEVQELFTDNVLSTAVNRRSDLITTLAPGLNITGDSARLRGVLDYSPAFYKYALTPGQDIVGHNLYASGTATLVPDLLFFDAHAYAALQPVTPALTTDLSSLVPTSGVSATAPANVFAPTAIPKSQLTQVTTAIASPYVQRRFGGYGTGELRYTFARNDFSGGNDPTTGTALAQGAADLTNEATATFITGDYFDRFTSQFLLDASRSTGAGVLDNARQNRAQVTTEFPLVGRVSALTTIGYEDLRFGGTPTVQIEEPVWAFGARLAATPERTLTVLYGRHDGITSPSVSLKYALTPLTRVSASYSDGISTSSEDIEQNLLHSARLQDQIVDARTLLPLPIHNPLLGIQLSLLRIKRATAGGYIDNKRDHFSATLDREEDLVLAQALPQTGTSLRATTASVGWAHDISALATAQLSASYSWVALLQTPVVNEQIFAVGASLGYLFNSTLRGSASYTYFHRDADQPLFKLQSNTIVISLHREF